MSEAMDADDFLAHYGVKGMKWGVRRGGVMSRMQGAASDRAARREARAAATVERFKKPVGAKQTIKNAALYGNFGVGPGRMLIEKMAKHDLAKAQADRKRIDAGKMKVRDYMTISTADMFISARPKDS